MQMIIVKIKAMREMDEITTILQNGAKNER
jgi:hypothetical protein